MIYRVSWSFEGARNALEYTDRETAQWNHADIAGYEHIKNVRTEEIHENREPRKGIFSMDPPAPDRSTPTRFNREDPL